MKLTLLTLALSVSALAQTTLVTATVASPDGVAFAGSSYLIQLVNANNNPLYVPNGNTYSGPRSYTGSLDSTGSFSLALTPNAAIVAGSQWAFTITPLRRQDIVGFKPNLSAFSASAVISGTSQSLSSLLSSAAPYALLITAAASGINTPAFTGPAKAVANSSQLAPLAATDIVNLFSGCSGTMVLAANGACTTPSGGGAATFATLTGNVTDNSALASALSAKQNTLTSTATTVNGQSCSLGGTCTIATGSAANTPTTTGLYTVTGNNTTGTATPIITPTILQVIPPCGTASGTCQNSTTGVISNHSVVNPQTGTTYTIASSDIGGTVTLNNSSAVSVFIPTAGSSNTFINGDTVMVRNYGTGTATLTPSTGTINNGASSVQIAGGNSGMLTSNGVGYDFIPIAGTSGSGTTVPGQLIVTQSASSNTVAAAVSAGTATSAPFNVVIPSIYAHTEAAACANFNTYWGQNTNTGITQPCTIPSNSTILDNRYNWTYEHNPAGYSIGNNFYENGISITEDTDNPISFQNRFGFYYIQNALSGGHNDSVSIGGTQSNIPNKTNFETLGAHLVKRTMGQGIGLGASVESYTHGDALAQSNNVTCVGGFEDATAEGCQLQDNQMFQAWDVPRGTIATGGSGLGSISLTFSTDTYAGTAFAGDHRLLVDKTISYTTGTISAIASTAGGSTVATGAGVTWPASTMIAQLGTQIPTNGGSVTFTPASYTVGSSAQLSTSSVYCVGPTNFEQIKPSAVSGSTATATFTRSHQAADTISTGGYCQYALTLLADDKTATKFSGSTMQNPPSPNATISMTWPILSSTANTVTLSVVGRGSTQNIPTEWTATLNTYRINPAIEVASIIQNGTPSNTWTLYPNTLTLATGDSFEEAQPASKGFSFGQQVMEKYSPSFSTIGGGWGMAYNGFWSDNDQLFGINNNTPLSFYTTHGGSHTPPLGWYQNGALSFNAVFQYGGRNGGFFLGCPDTGCTNAFYPFLHWGDASGGNQIYVDEVHNGAIWTTGGTAYDFMPTYFGPHGGGAANSGQTSGGWAAQYFTSASTCATPSSGVLCLYANTTDGTLHTVTSTGTDAAIGGASSGAAGGGLTGTYPNPGIASGSATAATCAGSPGNTTGAYKSQCQATTSGNFYTCNNAAGCTVAANWLLVGPTTSALTAAQLVAALPVAPSAAYLMTDGSGTTLTDSSGNGNNGTITLATWKNSNYLHFATASNTVGGVALPAAVLNNAQTVMIWFNPASSCTGGFLATCDAYSTLIGPDTGGVGITGTYAQFGNFSPGVYGVGAERYTGPSSIAVVTGSPLSLYKNGQITSMLTSTNLSAFTATTTFLLGGSYNGFAYNFNGDVYSALFFTSKLTAAQIAAVEASMRGYLLSTKGIAIKDNVNYDASPAVFLGDSITASAGASNLNTSYTYYAMQYSPEKEPWNLGINGDTLSNMVTRATAQAQPIVQRFSGTNPSILVEGGTNDIIGNATASTIYANMQTICTSIQQIPAVCVVGTISAATRNSGGQETVRTTTNASEIAGYLNGTLAAGAIADFGGDPILGSSLNTSNTYYFADGLHPTNAGNQIMGNIAGLAIQTALGARNKPFTLPVKVPRGNLVATSATTGTIKLLQLGTNQKVCGVTVKPLSPSLGTGLSAFTISVGDALGTATTYTSAFSAFGAASNTNFQDTMVLKSASYAGGVVQANFNSTGANVNQGYTDLVVDGTTNTKVSSASYTFTSLDVGTDIYISAGTGFTVGSYHVYSVTGGAATLDHSPGAVGTTGGTYILGEINVDICVVTAP